MSRTGPSEGPSPHSGEQVPHRVDAVPREARPFQGQRAGIVTRTAANVIDFCVVVGVLAFGYAAWAASKFLLNPPGNDRTDLR